MLNKFIKLYTPFLCAIVSIVHIALYFIGYTGNAYSVMNDLTGHSIIMNIYILIHSKRMCIWYKSANYLLMSIHFVNISYRIGLIPSYYIMYILLLINISALMCWLIFLVTYRTAKIVCPDRKH